MLFDLHKLCWTPAAAVASISWSVLICEDSKQGTIALDTTGNTAGEKRWFLRLFPELPQVEASSRLNLVRSSEQRFLRMPRTQARANLSKWALINYANKLFIFTILNVKRIFDSIVSENLCCSGGGSLLLASYQLGSYNQAREGEWRRIC